MNKKTINIEIKYRKKRYDSYERGNLDIKHLLWHRFTNRIFVMLLMMQRIVKRQKLIIVNDRHLKNGKATIFSPTHIGGADVEMVFEGIGEPAWFMMADPREMYHNFPGAMMKFNGVIAFDSDHKKDRHIAKMRSMELLRKGGNLIIFSEGAYNISPNKLVMHPYAGTAEMAIDTNSDIVPVALVRDGNKYYMNIGKNIDASKYSPDRKYELTEYLRNTLATLVWEIIEKMPVTKRRDISPDYYENIFIKEMFEDVGDYTYTLQDVKNTLLKPKNIVEPDDVFAFMHESLPKAQ
ncbi:lysophospholipid acyltransferase family protein [Butyrivibrio sp. M55]|uniref:lysophospholipid acyltransferase family protein n=1 Tax=Butyrivibrio sp. M55 TaxID=1855323 RepID=UPI0008F1A4CF|nr:1-acyl-sn-glycerol-3-phosphate acyltransferase [Butyrivibrio sp. M55]SFU45592.1 1-acyl-sn-glycerol-3-phosphate acyltransferase [Butyrivibrio sp. M55]